jgi:hypothetical protein
VEKPTRRSATTRRRSASARRRPEPFFPKPEPFFRADLQRRRLHLFTDDPRVSASCFLFPIPLFLLQ